MSNLNTLEELVLSHMRASNIPQVNTLRGMGKSTLVFVMDSLSELQDIGPSKLERELDAIIDAYWYWRGSLELKAMLLAQKRKPNTKDLFRSKSTPHTFPWYHRNRKY